MGDLDMRLMSAVDGGLIEMIPRLTMVIRPS